MNKKLLSNLKRLGVCLLLPFIAQQAMAQESTGANVTDGYYNILTSEGKYVNVAGRKTVNFVSGEAAKTKAGTVIRVKANSDGQVEILRSQGVDIPGYAERAMNYVPKIVQLVVNKLHASGSGEILGTDGLQAIMDKFNASFDYHLYLESAGGDTYRIYGKTPSMLPVVQFYFENKAKVDAKLPQLEQFINDAIQKVLKKTGGSGASILVPFSLETVWKNMGSNLHEPGTISGSEDQLLFLQDVLSNENNVWNFAYQTAMIYWKPLINHQKIKDNLDELGDLAKYVEKIEYIRPNVKYYIVENNGKLDVNSEDNAYITGGGGLWTLTPCASFSVDFTDAVYQETGNNTKAYYTTLYTDFAYTLPESGKVKALKVTGVSDAGVAQTEEITGTIPAQTPVLLMSTDTENLIQELTLSTEEGTSVSGNLLQGPDYIINKYNITSAQVEKLFGIVHDLFVYENMESFYNNNFKQYEYLMARNAGTVNNKYFFGLSGTDLGEADVNVGQLIKEEKGVAFSHNLESIATNKAFLVSDSDPVYLTLKGDINMDGLVNVEDVTTLVDYILKKNPSPCNIDACDVNEDSDINVADVTSLVDIILGK